jgi:hypothetical protein
MAPSVGNFAGHWDEPELVDDQRLRPVPEPRCVRNCLPSPPWRCGSRVPPRSCRGRGRRPRLHVTRARSRGGFAHVGRSDQQHVAGSSMDRKSEITHDRPIRARLSVEVELHQRLVRADKRTSGGCCTCGRTSVRNRSCRNWVKLGLSGYAASGAEASCSAAAFQFEYVRCPRRCWERVDRAYRWTPPRRPALRPRASRSRPTRQRRRRPRCRTRRGPATSARGRRPANLPSFRTGCRDCERRQHRDRSCSSWAAARGVWPAPPVTRRCRASTPPAQRPQPLGRAELADGRAIRPPVAIGDLSHHTSDERCASAGSVAGVVRDQRPVTYGMRPFPPRPHALCASLRADREIAASTP